MKVTWYGGKIRWINMINKNREEMKATPHKMELLDK